MADMRMNCAGTSARPVTTIFGIDRADTGHMFDDLQLTRAVTTSYNRAQVITHAADSMEDEEERNVRELVIRLPQMSDTSNTRASNTRSSTGEGMRLDPVSHRPYNLRKKSTSEIQPKAVHTAVCEVFQFSNGSINNLKPAMHHIASLPSRRRAMKSPDKNALHTNNNNFERHQLNLNIDTDNARPTTLADNARPTTLADNARPTTLSAKRRLNFFNMMKKYYDNNNSESLMYGSMPKLPNIPVDSLAAIKRQAKSSPAKIAAANSTNKDSEGYSEGYSDMDCDELRSVMATRGESRRSVESLQQLADDSCTAEIASNERTESPWPPTAQAMMITQVTANVERHSKETMKIYHKSRKLNKLSNKAAASSSGLPKTAAEHKYSTSHHSKLPSIETYQGSASGERAMTASQENRMFAESYYDQFSHRKLKKIVTPSERRRSRAEATNLMSKQYDRREAMQYIKVKIGKGVESTEDVEVTETVGDEEDEVTMG